MLYIKKIALSLLSLFCTVILSAQTISVKDFYLDEMDQTANLHGTTVIDQNGYKCALIRIQTTQKGFSFDVGSLGVKKTDDTKTGEIWVYVPPMVKKIDIRHDKIGNLLGYEFPVSIKEARTYIMTLTTANVKTIVEEQITSQYLILKVTPPNAFVYIDDQPTEVVDGAAMAFLPFGVHRYKVVAPGYFEKTGEVNIADAENKVVQEVQLSPDQAAVSVTCDMADAEIWINREKKGMGAWTGNLKSGTYLFEARKAGHRGKILQKEIKSGETNLTFALESPTPAYGKLNISVKPVGAKIYIDGEEKGTTPTVINNVLFGKHTLTMKSAGYKDYTQSVDIEEGKIFNVTAAMERNAESQVAAVSQVAPAVQPVSTPVVTQNAGTPEDMFVRAQRLRFGIGGERNKEAAIALFKKVAETNSSNASEAKEILDNLDKEKEVSIGDLLRYPFGMKEKGELTALSRSNIKKICKDLGMKSQADPGVLVYPYSSNTWNNKNLYLTYHGNPIQYLLFDNIIKTKSTVANYQLYFDKDILTSDEEALQLYNSFLTEFKTAFPGNGFFNKMSDNRLKHYNVTIGNITYRFILENLQHAYYFTFVVTIKR